MLEALIVVLLAVIVRDHRARMKSLGEEARSYGREQA